MNKNMNSIENENMKDIFKDSGKILLDEFIETFWKDNAYLIKLGLIITKLPLSIRDYVLWKRVEKLIRGIKSDPDFEARFAAKIANTDKREDFARRIILILDKIDESEKVDYIINAMRALCWNKIDNSQFFRICKAIRGVYIDDLIFLKDHYKEDRYFFMDMTVQELTSYNLMYMAVVDGGSPDPEYKPSTHAFTELGALVYYNALNYEQPKRIME
ncbi:MAG: hypothetical protein IJE51_06750 [Clostridia bacterium]|nr:hypothetical protein [Clostridia bacterium]